MSALEAFREAFEWSLEGPLGELTDLPSVILHGVVIVFFHSVGNKIGRILLEALVPVLGPGRLSRGLLGQRLRFEGPPAVWVRAGQSGVRLVFKQRLKPKRLSGVLRALRSVPGARDLRLTGERQRFGPIGARSGGGMMEE